MAMDVVDQVWFSRQGPRSCNQSNWNLSRFRNSLKSQSSYVFNSKSCTDFKMFELWSFSLQCLTSSYCTEEKLQKMHEQSFPNKKPIENAGTHLDLCVFSKFGIFWSCENAPRNIREKIVIFHYNWPRSDQPYYRSDGTKSEWQISSLSHNCQPTCQIVFFMEFSHLSFISTFDFDGWVVFIKVQPFGKAFPQRQRSIENKYKLLHLICHCFPTFPAIIIIIKITYIKNNLSLQPHLICAHILCKL